VWNDKICNTHNHFICEKEWVGIYIYSIKSSFILNYLR
jgi:hypothetical protein